ncbi:MAG: extracellular solute-binding protein, partial [Lachnospiraceae bacterium]|nr:extracellular solute-binding protein [Lachnospiraceae bacterium]
MGAVLGENMKRRIMAAALILLLALGFSGCGKKDDSASMVKASRDYVYRLEEIELEGGRVNQILRAGNYIYGYGYQWSDDGDDYSLNFYKINEDGTLEGTYTIPIKQSSNLTSINMNDDGTIYCIKNDYYPVSEETDPETGEVISTSDEYVDEYYLVRMTLEGEELMSVKLTDIPEIKQFEEENGYFYVNSMILDKENGIYISAFERLLKFDLEGNYAGAIQGSGDNNLANANIVPLSEGRYAAVLYQEDKISLALADLDTGTVGEEYTIPGRSYDFSFYGGIGYDLYLVNNYGVYGYNLGDDDKTQIMSYIDSDMDIYNLYQLVGINENEFMALYDGSEEAVGRFIKVPPEEVKEKQVVTLAMAYTDWRVRTAVVKFNKENENYRISIQDYTSLYGTDDDYQAGLTRLNTDIVSGKVPDILVIDDSMPSDSYISKGLFEDMKPYIEKDSELDINNFMPNIIEAFSVDGKLYSIVDAYSIDTIAAKASEAGQEQGWTVEEVRKILDSKPEGTKFMPEVTRDSVLYNCMCMAGSQFVDWKEGTCNFDSDAFIQMLEFLGTFPEEIDETEIDDDYWENYDSMWRDGRAVASMMNLGGFRDYNRMEKGTFGEKIALVGFPSANGEGSVIRPNIQLAMSAKSKNKEGAWEFLRTFLTDEYQENEVNYCFPMSIRRLDELAAEAMKKPYYMDENN